LVAATASDEPLPADLEQRLSDFAELVGQALANADARERLAASRAELVEVSDAERHRLERNLHDGAQQRLATLALELAMLDDLLESQPEARRLLGQAQDDLADSLEELRELARGIHPAVLTDHGLAVAVEALAERTPLPLRLHVERGERLPQPVEVASYYLITECLANVAKYAHASEARVTVSRSNGEVVVEVADDGVGGASRDRGSGLRGLADRVEALGGSLEVSSPVGRGTRVTAQIPCAPG
jgi:signal transduction histidine kinase